MTYTELFNPIYATKDGIPVIVVGFRDQAVLVIDDDGHFSWCMPSDLIVDVRFRDGRWVDVSPGRPEVFDEEA
jgi:hypothetical protein